MDLKAMEKLTYGIYMLSTVQEEQKNGCIINTCMQVANDPARIAISVLNSNYTCELLKKSRIFAMSLLDEKCTFDTIRHFGYQSGRTVNKFEGIAAPKDCQNVPYLNWTTCSVISGKVTELFDLGTHTLFIGEIVDARLLNDHAPLTYADYQAHIKPKPEAISKDKKITGWRCKICGYIYDGSELPPDFVCPLCGHGADDFEPVYG